YSRGRCVVAQDLIAALQSGQFADAGLDVVDPEPLPPDSPLWGMRNVLIRPHVAILGTPYRQKWEAILSKTAGAHRGSASAQRRRQGINVLTARPAHCEFGTGRCGRPALDETAQPAVLTKAGIHRPAARAVDKWSRLPPGQRW